MSTNDDAKSPEDLLKKYQEQEKSRDYSQASKSSITSVGEDEQKKRGIAEGIISDLANQRSEIDVIKQAIQVLSSQQNEIAKMLNQQTQILNQLSQGTTAANLQMPAQGMNLDSINALGEIAEKLANVWKTYKGGDSSPALIDQETINREMQSAFFDNLNTGKSINNFVKDALKKKATKEILSSTMEQLGKDDHSPQ